MILPKIDELKEEVIIEIMNARFHNENQISYIRKSDRKIVLQLIRSIYYGDELTLTMSYTPYVISVLKKYSIINKDETINSLLKDGKKRTNNIYINKLLSDDFIDTLNQDVNKISKLIQDIDNEARRISIDNEIFVTTRKVAMKKINYN